MSCDLISTTSEHIVGNHINIEKLTFGDLLLFCAPIHLDRVQYSKFGTDFVMR